MAYRASMLARSLCLPAQRGICNALGMANSSLLTNLIAYYKFADANDSHTNALNLTEVNSPTYVAGQVGNCVNLVAASTQYLSSASGSFAVGANSAWWSMWIRAATLSPGHGIISKYGGAGQRGYLLFLGSSRPYFTVSDDGTAYVEATWGSLLSATTWYHIYCQFDATTRKGGISVNNGTLVESSALASGQLHTSTEAFQVGWNNQAGSPQYFDGRIDELAYGRGAVLTTTQRTNLYTAQLAGTGSYPFTGIP